MYTDYMSSLLFKVGPVQGASFVGHFSDVVTNHDT